MDIVSRIKIFMNYLQIANSQFADTCKIPRPTISQILNGRNKKISDEIIGKIHEAYPSLSVLWLMFGEGEMVIDSNIKISEPQNEDTIDFDNPHISVDEGIMQSIDFDENFSDSMSENSETQTDDQNQPEAQEITIKSTEKTAQQSNSISFCADSSKKIVNIMVFYSDNSFQQFTPIKP